MTSNPIHLPETPVLLSDRRLIQVSGADAQSFLQNIMSNDVDKTSGDRLVYSLLLTPQGQFLHDFFVLKDSFTNDGYLLDMHHDQVDEFLKRMVMFKLRAKVSLAPLSPDTYFIYSHREQGAEDPRLPALGRRFYTQSALADSADDVSLYHDARIVLGVADGSLTIKAQNDFPADMSLDHLHALGWDKGCFIGQEVVARMYHRGLAKKRLVIVTGAELCVGDILSPAGRPVGEMREVNTRGDTALALLRLDTMEDSGSLKTAGGTLNTVSLPDYLSI